MDKEESAKEEGDLLDVVDIPLLLDLVVTCGEKDDGSGEC